MNKRKLKGLEVLGEAPLEASQNLQAPETAPSNGRITGRTKPLSLKATPEFHKELKKLAAEEGCLMIEVLEKALESYKKEKSEKYLEKHIKIIPPKIKFNKLTPYSHVNFTCDKCGDEYEQDIAYSYAPNFKELNKYQTYCGGCVE